MRLSPKGKINSLRDGFVPPREKVVERPTPPWDRFTTPRKNDAGKFRKYSSRNRVFYLRGKFTPPNDKVVGKVTSSRELAGEGHVPSVKPVFPGSGPSSPRYRMMSPRCRPSIFPLNTCIYPMGVTLTHRSHITPLGPF